MSVSRKTLILGAVFVVLLAGVTALIFESFGGAFSSYSVLQAELPANSDAVSLNAPVEYRHVTVGSVASQGVVTSAGLISITIHVEPSMLSRIPADVVATETPISFFGDAYLVLVPPAHPSSSSLHAGQTIPPLATGQTASLQATLGDLDHLLISLHPAELDAALTAIAQAVQGQGKSLGRNIDSTNTYFSQMLPLWPTVVADLKTMVPVANQFAASAADIISILANQTVTAQTILGQTAQLRQAIGGGAAVAGQFTQLLRVIQQPYTILAADSGPFLQDLAQSPTEISDLLAGLDAWARTWTAAEASGPYLSLSADVTVANPADLGLAVLGGPQAVSYLSAGLGAGYVNPPTYTGPGTIPSTAAAGQLATLLASAMTSPPPPVLAAPAERAAVSEIVQAVSGSRPSSPDVASLLLSPVLTGLVSGR